MIVKATMFIVRNQQEAVVPMRRVPDGLVHGLDELFPPGYVIERVLRVSAREIAGSPRKNVSVARFDEDVVCRKAGIVCHFPKLVEAFEMAFEPRFGHALDTEDLRQFVTHEDGPPEARGIETVVGITAKVTLVEPKGIARATEGKARRVVDKRQI